MADSDTGGRDELSRRLRELRESAGIGGDKMAQTEAARISGVSQPTITRIERGQRIALPAQVRALCEAYQAPALVRDDLVNLAEVLRPRIHRVVLSRDYASVQKRIGRIQTSSAVVRGFTSIVPPGLLQTPAFARALFGDDTGADERIEGQSMLDDPDRRIEYVLTDGALGGTVLMPSEAAAQIAHLITLSWRPNVRIGVIPWGTPLPVVPVNTWESYDDRAVIAGTITGSATIVDSPDVEEYLGVYRHLASAACWDDEARALLAAAADRYRHLP